MRSGKIKSRLIRIPILILFISLALVMLIPIVWILFGAFKPDNEIISYPPTFFPHEFSLKNFTKCMQRIDIIQYIKNIKLTFDVNSIALLFGEKILGRPDIITHLIQEEVEGKHYILTCLRDHGYQCRDCNGNFILVKPQSDATILSKKLQAEKKILVHSYGDPLLKEYLRISVGSKKAMEPFLTVFLELDQA